MSKKILLITFFLGFELIGFAQPKIHFNFISHNEETAQWNATQYYNANRLKLITLANYFQANGITWNMQSDWRYLTGVLTKETTALMMSTNNKNILRWLYEDKGVEMDPHAHESTYLYPDVVNLMDSIGLPESKLMGGTIYNDSNGVNVWTNLVNGQYGIIFPNKFWQPDYMMGGGTPNHVNDLKYFGFWNPMDTAHYLVHDSASHLRHIGVGCEIKIKDTISVSYILSQINDVVNSVQSGQYPSNGFYVQTIFFEQGDLNDSVFYNKVIAIADSVNELVSAGVGQWNTLKESYNEWETTFNAQVFQWECGQVVNEINPIETTNTFLYPDPANNTINLGLHPGDKFKVNIYNATGSILYQGQVDYANPQIVIQSFPQGIYFYQLTNAEQTSTTGKFVVARSGDCN
ncbi:MAG: T9SS type A sorting domain-containing protein [Bacteroidota bacterium]